MKYINILREKDFLGIITLVLCLVLMMSLTPTSIAGPAKGSFFNFPDQAGAGLWKQVPLKTHASFRALSIVSQKVIWASGSGSTWVRSLDGGKKWDEKSFAGADSALDFRAIMALDAQTAWLMSSGESEKGLARIYRTQDGGMHWKLQYKALEPGIFLDGLHFWNSLHGIAFGDPVKGHFYILLTQDGGIHWIPLNSKSSPASIGAEGAFAASGTSLCIGPGGRAWIGTGGLGGGRVFSSIDFGHTWSTASTPLKTGPAAGIFGLCFLNNSQGIALGGDYIHTQDGEKNAACTTDGGRTWLPAQVCPSGLREAAVFLPASHLLVAIGPSGTSTSVDSGKRWIQRDSLGFHAIAFQQGNVWAIGGKGKLAKLEISIK